MNELKNKILYILVPCYNEEVVLPKTAPLFLDKLKSLINKFSLSDDSKVVFANDGSNDRTYDLIKELCSSDKHIAGISLSKNMGHQNALLALLTVAYEKSDFCISIDCDGQDDVNAMDEMLTKYSEGAEIVYGVRKNRDKDSFFKKWTAETYYKLLQKLGSNTVYNSAEYRFASKKAMEIFFKFSESNLFLRGIFPLIGYKQDKVYYDRENRVAGNTHYSIRKMLSLALNGITNLSIEPLRFIFIIGLTFVLIGVIGSIVSVILNLKVGTGFNINFLVFFLCLLSGIQLMCMGVVAEYVGKTYIETKHRPKFIISDKVGL